MISFEDEEYELDDRDSYVMLIIYPDCDEMRWSIEVNSLDPQDAMPNTEEGSAEVAIDETEGEDGFYYEPILARLYFTTPLNFNWAHSSGIEWKNELKLEEDLNLEPNDPAMLWKGEAYLPLKHHLKIARDGETTVQLDWECEARDQLIVNFLYKFACHARVRFTGVHVKLLHEPIDAPYDPAMSHVDVERKFAERAKKMTVKDDQRVQADELIRPFLEFARFEGPESREGGFFYPLRCFKETPGDS